MTKLKFAYLIGLGAMVSSPAEAQSWKLNPPRELNGVLEYESRNEYAVDHRSRPLIEQDAQKMSLQSIEVSGRTVRLHTGLPTFEIKNYAIHMRSDMIVHAILEPDHYAVEFATEQEALNFAKLLRDGSVNLGLSVRQDIRDQQRIYSTNDTRQLTPAEMKRGVQRAFKGQPIQINPSDLVLLNLNSQENRQINVVDGLENLSQKRPLFKKKKTGPGARPESGDTEATH